MRSDPKHFFFALTFFVLTLIGFGYYHFHHEQRESTFSVETALKQSVDTAHIFIGDQYHDAVFSAAPNEIEQADTVRMLTSLAHAQGVDQVYSVALDSKGNLRVTAGNAQFRQTNGGYRSYGFFETLPSSPDILRALKSNQPVWHTDDSQNHFKNLYVPFTTPSGYRYVISAEMETSSIQKFSNAAAFKGVITSLIIFVGALPLLLIYRNTLRGTAVYLQEKVTTATDELREINELLENKVEEKTKQLISQSFEDTLTGLPNRHRLQYDMDRKTFHALLIINLHNFREINDFFGIQTGDDLLRQMAHWLQTLDFNPYRLSGDEFAILLETRQSREELETLVSHMLHRLSDHPFNVGEESVSLNVTIGIDVGPGLTLSHADIALHEAKESSKHYAFYDSRHNIEERYKSNIAMTKQIHEAVNAGRIICYYQPIASIHTGKIEKYETLARMIDEHARIIPPMEFIKIAQKTRLYPKITQGVIEQACNTFRTREEEFSVNLSIRDIIDPHIVRFIEETIVQTDTARRIVFEILESEGIDNFGAVIEFISKMKRLGAKIAIDDFGTGYSSMENILKLDVDYIKIDGSLIRNITIDPKHALVVESIKDFATKMGAKTIAEFVSSEEIFEKIKSIGIDYAQGYHIGKPASLSL